MKTLTLPQKQINETLIHDNQVMQHALMCEDSLINIKGVILLLNTLLSKIFSMVLQIVLMKCSFLLERIKLLSLLTHTKFQTQSCFDYELLLF